MSMPGKGKTRANVNSKNVLFHETVTSYQLSFQEAVNEINLYHKDLLPGKSNIESYLKTICYHADEEILHGSYDERARMRDEIYHTFSKNRFHDQKWYSDGVKPVIRGQLDPKHVPESFIEQAVSYYPMVVADSELSSSKHKIEQFLRRVGVDIEQISHEAAATSIPAIDAYEFNRFILEASRLLDRQGNLDVLVQKYGKEKTKQYYHQMKRFESAIFEKLYA